MSEEADKAWKEHVRKKRKAYYELHKEELLIKCREYYQKHKEMYNKRNRAYYQKIKDTPEYKERIKVYANKYPEAQRLASRTYYAKHKHEDIYKERARKCRQTDAYKKWRSAYIREYYKKNREKILEKSKDYYNRKVKEKKNG